jgi:rare lipoprotein A
MATDRPSRQSRQPNAKPSLRIYLLAAVTSVVWVAGVVTIFFTQTVQADAPLPRPIATMPPAPPVLLAPTTAPTKARRHDLLRGLATWYGGSFNGRLTASGKPFDMFEMTACHPTLPFGSVVRVRNLRNNHSVVVSITDRGYLLEGRIIDLSFAAAEELKMTNAGVAPVALEVIALGPQRRRR